MTEPKEDPPMIAVLLPSQSLPVREDEAVIRWLPVDEDVDSTEYLVEIRNIFDDLIFNERTNETSMTIHFDDLPNESGLYIFKVHQSKNREIVSQNYGIKKLRSEDRVDVTDGLSKLLAQETEDQVQERLLLADFYEKHGLLLDAITQYEKALEVTPEQGDLRSRYNDFLAKYSMKYPED